MTKFATLLSLLLLCPAPIYASSFQNSAISANECEGANKACSAAARELKAARDLIIGYEAHIAAAEDRIKIAYKELEILKQAGDLQSARAKELEGVIAAEREQVALSLKRIELQQQRITQLEKQLGRAKKFALITGVAAVVAILIGASK